MTYRVSEPDPVGAGVFAWKTKFERLDPEPNPVCPERLDPDPVNIRPDPKPW